MKKIKTFIFQYLLLLKLLAIPFFFILLISTHIDQLLSESIENQLKNPSGTSSTVWIFAAGSILLSLMIPWVLQLVGLAGICRLKNQTSPIKFFKKNAELLAIETLRGWGKMVSYSMLLILPGLWKFLQYQPLPWVVCLSRNYDHGSLDALEASARLFARQRLTITLSCAFFLLAWPMASSSLFDQNQLFWISPVKSIIFHILETMIHVLFIQLMTNIFVALLKESNDELIF